MKFLYYLGRTSIAFVKLKEKPCAPDNLSAINGSFSMAKCGSSKCFLTDAFSLVLYVILVFREIRDVITAPLSNNRCVLHFLLFMCFQKCEKRYCRPRFFFFFTWVLFVSQLFFISDIVLPNKGKALIASIVAHHVTLFLKIPIDLTKNCMTNGGQLTICKTRSAAQFFLNISFCAFDQLGTKKQCPSFCPC